MEYLTELVVVGLTAAIMENVVFTRALGQNFHKHYSKGVSTLLLEGIVITAFSTLGSFAGWLGRYLSESVWSVQSWAKPGIFISIYAVCVFLVLIAIKITAVKTKREFVPISCMLIYGFIPIATILVVAGHEYSIMQATLYGIGAGIGYLFASLINCQIQRRLVYSDIPISFRGIPISLLTFGIMSLALFGLVGHEILL